VESLLGEHSNLVNLDNLTQLKSANTAAKKPFPGCSGSQANDEPTDDRKPGFLWHWFSLAR